MGPITDHDFEHLAPSDLMITRTRRRLLQAARALRDSATAPPGADHPEVYFGARAGSFLHDPTVPLPDAYQAQLAQAVRWPGPPP
jgi:phthalate 4,5-dioxygenase oxygenase subunit